MKKNDKKIISNFRGNYLMSIPSIIKITEDQVDKAEIGEYFGEVKIGCEFFIPNAHEANLNHCLRFSFKLQIQLTEENKLDIVYDDIRRTQIRIHKRHTNELINLTALNDVYSSSFEDVKFSDFTKQSLDEFNNVYEKINESSFFDFKVRKNRLVPSKDVLSYVQNKMNSTIKLTVERLVKGDDDSLFEIYKGSESEMEHIEEFSQAIKLAEKALEYKQLSGELNNLDKNLNKRVKI